MHPELGKERAHPACRKVLFGKTAERLINKGQGGFLSHNESRQM